MRYILCSNAISVIPACPESFPPQRKDSGQAEMTLGLHFSMSIRCRQQLISNVNDHEQLQEEERLNLLNR
jgi:hypothetical protein